MINIYNLSRKYNNLVRKLLSLDTLFLSEQLYKNTSLKIEAENNEQGQFTNNQALALNYMDLMKKGCM